MKGNGVIRRVFEQEPDRLDWWVTQEEQHNKQLLNSGRELKGKHGVTFRNRMPMRAVKDLKPSKKVDKEILDCYCGDD